LALLVHNGGAGSEFRPRGDNCYKVQARRARAPSISTILVGFEGFLEIQLHLRRRLVGGPHGLLHGDATLTNCNQFTSQIGIAIGQCLTLGPD
jgi:hypothetical protein